MKVLKYNLAIFDENNEKKIGSMIEMPYSDANLEIANGEAYGEIEIIESDDFDSVITPTQLDIIEAQVTYTAMMTDTLLEV